MIGKEFKVQVADGYAKYEVTEDLGDGTVVVERRPDCVEIGGRQTDIGYTCSVLGYSCRIAKENIERLVR